MIFFAISIASNFQHFHTISKFILNFFRLFSKSQIPLLFIQISSWVCHFIFPASTFFSCLMMTKQSWFNHVVSLISWILREYERLILAPTLPVNYEKWSGVSDLSITFYSSHLRDFFFFCINDPIRNIFGYVVEEISFWCIICFCPFFSVTIFVE